ncbi:MAG: 50S ribosomal protein L6 [Elusimicrobia bacterium]|nr:50S ribosomal protein L6 [Elusimicrobiota bacterium]
MSKIGRLPIDVPSGVQIQIEGGTVKAKGPKGDLREGVPAGVQVKLQDGKIRVESAQARESRKMRALFGTTRARIANMVRGVHVGFTQVLEVVGLGYKAQAAGNKLTLSLGRSHPVEFQVPPGLQVAIDPKSTQITLTGADIELIGAAAASLRALRPPEPYKGTGIRYQGEHIHRKAGKTAAGVGAGAGAGAKK